MINTIQIPTETVLTRIDAIIEELHWLRQAVLATDKSSSPNIIDELAGSLGKGNWEEYDLQLDWERFSE